MAELTTEHLFAGNLTTVFAGIRQYQRYPEFLPGVTGIQILPATAAGSTCQVRYDVKLLKTFHYTLNMFEEKPNKIWWNLESSNILKKSSGAWTLSSAGPTSTKAIYQLEISFSGLVPQRIVDQLTKANLPAMMEGFQRLIAESNPERSQG